MKKERKELKDNELTEVNGGMKIAVEEEPEIEEDDNWFVRLWKGFLKTLSR